MQHKAAASGLALEVASAGTAASHKGQGPDPRSIRVASPFGYSFKGFHAKPVKSTDFASFDIILAMDRQNLHDLQQRCPAEHQHKLCLFMSHHPAFAQWPDVPDPYYGGNKGFDLVLQLIEEGCDHLLAHLKRTAA
ncbi:protein-tyrosine-phosphatase [Alishewanella tabrizica]|uniref:protein-tyrosine-phosphatase n=2 Tax=Alishewanella tabrizica TaxID=671278 RepID=A0ABQ2WJ72_9ALTE|nr:protein-tyrosine-phosphatase [Alishewanella tabrizica]